MRTISRLNRSGKLIVAALLAGSAFGIATAVQASIPDSNLIVHSCYNTSLAHGDPIGAMRAIDTAKTGTAGSCTGWEGAVDLATPQYVQKVVTSTVNQTAVMGNSNFGGATLATGNWWINWNCGGWVATNPTVAVDPFADNPTLDAPITMHAVSNYEAQTSGFAGTNVRIYFSLSAPEKVATQVTCVDPRVFGESYPVSAPQAQPMVTKGQS